MSLSNETKIGYLTSSISAARDLLSSLNSGKAPLENTPIQVYPALDTLRLMEHISRHNFSLLIVEEELMNALPKDWLSKLERTIKNKDQSAELPPILLILKENKNANDLRLLLSIGFAGIVTRQLDNSILLQKIDKLIPEAKILSENQFYKMQTENPVRVAICQVFESISETEATLLSNKLYLPGEVVSLFGEPFDNATENQEVVAVCTVCETTGNSLYPYRVIFHLQGITPAVAQSIRKWIKDESARQAMARLG